LEWVRNSELWIGMNWGNPRNTLSELVASALRNEPGTFPKRSSASHCIALFCAFVGLSVVSADMTTQCDAQELSVLRRGKECSAWLVQLTTTTIIIVDIAELGLNPKMVWSLHRHFGFIFLEIPAVICSPVVWVASILQCNRSPLFCLRTGCRYSISSAYDGTVMPQWLSRQCLVRSGGALRHASWSL
jgi:hypothetical protein